MKDTSPSVVLAAAVIRFVILRVSVVLQHLHLLRSGVYTVENISLSAAPSHATIPVRKLFYDKLSLF